MTQQAIVLAGGKGERLWPLTRKKPKPMVEVAGKPLIVHHLNWLCSQGVQEVILACGYQAETIVRFLNRNQPNCLRIRYSIEDKPLGRGGAIKQAALRLSQINEPVIISQADIITDIPVKEAVSSHLSFNAVLTMVVVPYRSRYGVVDIDPDGSVQAFREKPRLPYWANTGIFVVLLTSINIFLKKAMKMKLFDLSPNTAKSAFFRPHPTGVR